MRLRALALPTVLAALAPPAAAQGVVGPAAPRGVVPRAGVVFVDALAAGANNGKSWKDAFVRLQDGLAAAVAGSEVWVASATYTPSDAASSFVLPSGVGLYGGFDGTEVTRDQRDWLANPTVLSGDVGHDDVVGSGSGWYLSWNINTANAGHVVDASGVAAGTTVDGFTIADGNTGPVGTPAGDPLMWGGGVYALGGSPTVCNCTFTHHLCAWARGGSVYVHDGYALLEHCLFLENYAHGGGGAGVGVTGFGSATVRDCEFRYNQCVATDPSGARGAGLGHEGDDLMVIERCVFEDNVGRPFYPVGDELAYGGGIFAWGPLEARDCTFTGNRANFGGGLIAWSDALVVGCLFHDNEAVPQPNDPYPEQGGYGAGITAYSYAAAEARVVGCTIAHNHGKKFVGLVTLGAGAHATIEDSVLWGNSATHPEVVGYWTEQLDGSFDAAYSCIAHIFEPKAPGEDAIDPGDLPGCIDLDPLFVSSGAGDLRLAAGSPCADAGDNDRLPADVVTDLDGNPRFVNDPAAPDTGNGTPPLVDMGAYERQ